MNALIAFERFVAVSQVLDFVWNEVLLFLKRCSPSGGMCWALHKTILFLKCSGLVQAVCCFFVK